MNPVFGEAWTALPFIPAANVRVKTVRAAIDYYGPEQTEEVNLGIYRDNDGVPGTLLPGAQGSSTGVSAYGACCDFATVRFLGAGIALTGGVQYWLVGSPNNVDAPEFDGFWQITSECLYANLKPAQEQFWFAFGGDWMAAQITGSSQ
jgi:hypothetical protein